MKQTGSNRKWHGLAASNEVAGGKRAAERVGSQQGVDTLDTLVAAASSSSSSLIIVVVVHGQWLLVILWTSKYAPVCFIVSLSLPLSLSVSPLPYLLLLTWLKSKQITKTTHQSTLNRTRLVSHLFVSLISQLQTALPFSLSLFLPLLLFPFVYFLL